MFFLFLQFQNQILSKYVKTFQIHTKSEPWFKRGCQVEMIYPRVDIIKVGRMALSIEHTKNLVENRKSCAQGANA
jgi:hypothetical protein